MERKTTFIKPEPPYDNYTHGSMYIHPTEQRRIVVLSGNGNKQLCTAYARYLYNVHLYKTEGRILTKDEVVDHINNDRLDDRLENYQILSNAENIIKANGNRGRYLYLLICPICGKIIACSKRQTSLVNCRKNIVKYCSKECSYEALRRKITKETIEYIVVIWYNTHRKNKAYGVIIHYSFRKIVVVFFNNTKTNVNTG